MIYVSWKIQRYTNPKKNVLDGVSHLEGFLESKAVQNWTPGWSRGNMSPVGSWNRIYPQEEQDASLAVGCSYK